MSIAQRVKELRNDNHISYNETKLWKNAAVDDIPRPKRNKNPSKKDNSSTKENESKNNKGKQKSKQKPKSQKQGIKPKNDFSIFQYEKPVRRTDRIHKPVIFSSADNSSEEDNTTNDEYSATEYNVEEETEAEETEYEEEEDYLEIEKIYGFKEDQNGPLFFTKFKDMSFKHCKWLTQAEIEEFPNGPSLLKRCGFENLLQTHEDSSNLYISSSIPDLHLFDSENDIHKGWLEVDRIIDEDRTAEGIDYLVKWKNLEYDAVTWEKESDLMDPSDLQAIQRFQKWKTHSNPIDIPSRYTHPPGSAFEQLTEKPKSNDGTLELRDYQLEGLNWLRYCWYNDINSILADQMGLGKTAQIVTMLNALYKEQRISGPFLIVAPMSTLNHWKYEIERWTNFNAIIFHGTSDSRDIILENEWYPKDARGRNNKSRVKFDVLITNYEMLKKELNLFIPIVWRYLVIDEAHKIKNSNSALYSALMEIDAEHVTLLTGTPIQNNTEELWSLLHFLDRYNFESLEDFQEKYGDLKDAEQVKKLHEIIKPIMLRRKKSDVEKDLMPKEETVIEVELTRVQKRYYRALLNDNASTLLKTITGGSTPSLLNIMMQLRKVCNHPFLIRGAEEVIMTEKTQEAQIHNMAIQNNQTPDPEDQKKTPDSFAGEGLVNEDQIKLKGLVDSSGKLILIDKLLPKLRSGGHKVLIFSQMVKVLNLLEQYLELKGYPHERLDGSTHELDRNSSIERFNQDPNAFIFLLSTKAGGVGINLTAADTVIIYDSDWNPQNDIQAQDRCHRIGQQNIVKVYRLITRETYESEMYKRASLKLALDHVVLDGGEAIEEKPEELEAILRNGVNQIFDEDNTELDNFCTENIDQILSQRAKVFTQDVVAGGQSIFAKAQFDAGDKDHDSTEFWSRLLDQHANDDSIGTVRRCRELHEMKMKQLKLRRLNRRRGQSYDVSESEYDIDVPGERKLTEAERNISRKIRALISKLTNYGLSHPPKQEELEILLFALTSTNIDSATVRLIETDFANVLSIIRANSAIIPDFADLFSQIDNIEEFEKDDNKEFIELLNSFHDKLSVKIGTSLREFDQRSKKIIKRVGLIDRLMKVASFIQQLPPGFKWPDIKPSWENPLQEYTLLLCTLRHGFGDSDRELKDPLFESLSRDDVEPLREKTVETRLTRFAQAIESQAKDGSMLPTDANLIDEGSFLAPIDWALAHQDVCKRESFNDLDIKELISAVCTYGLPITTEPFDLHRIKLIHHPRILYENSEEEGESEAKKISREAVKVEPRIDVEKLLWSEKLKNVSPEKVAIIADELNVWANTGIVEKDIEIALPFLTPELKDRMLMAISSLAPVHLFAVVHGLDMRQNWNIDENSDPAFANLKKPKNCPEWWTTKHSLGFIRALHLFGLRSVRDWMEDESLPFTDPATGDLMDLKFLYREITRMNMGAQIVKEIFAAKKILPLKIGEDFILKKPGTLAPPHIGFKAVRYFPSVKNPQEKVAYKMKVNHKGKFVIKSKGERYRGADPVEAWKKVQKKMVKMGEGKSDEELYKRVANHIHPILLSGICNTAVVALMQGKGKIKMKRVKKEKSEKVEELTENGKEIEKEKVDEKQVQSPEKIEKENDNEKMQETKNV